MKLSKKLLSVASATAMLAGGMVTPIAAQAEVSASMAFSNMYLWRGQNLSPNGSVISGSLDYSHESGAYAGVWTTSETGGTETDLYAGFGGEAGGVSYDVSYWMYLYPEDGGTGPLTGLSDTDLSEIVGSVGYGPVTFTLYMGVDTEFQNVDPGDYYYYTIGFDVNDQVNITYGGWSWDKVKGADYNHLTLSYSPVDDFTFTISKAMEDATDSIEEDPLFQVTYSKSFDLKK
ncbi:TorF family putative porin [Kaarinaea lacus]